MAKRIAVSFEDDVVRVLYASLSGGNVKIIKTLLLKNEEFDAFLAGEKSREFIVVSDFKVSFSDILSLPPAKDKYLRQLIETEVSKKAPELKDFSFSYNVLGETVREGRKSKEVFCYAVNNADLFQIIQRFDKHNKTVKYIYPFAAALCRLINGLPVENDEPKLCIAETGLNKTMFLVKNKKVHFIRSAQSMEPGIHDLDVHDINITVNYCKQTLRITPSSILLLSNLCSNFDASMSFSIPASCILLPEGIQAADGQEASDYLAAIAAVLPNGETGSISIVPRPYAILSVHNRIVNALAVLFVVAALAALWRLKYDVSEVLKLKGDIDALRVEIGQMTSNRQNYENLTRQLGEYVPLINFVNSVNSVPDVQAALIRLSSIKMLHGDSAQLASININAVAGALDIQMSGNLKPGKFAETDMHYSALLSEIRALKGMTVVSETMDINNRNFHIEMQYHDK